MPQFSVDGTPPDVIIRHMGREVRQGDVLLGHKQIQPSPRLKVTNHASLADRKVSDHRLNPRGTAQKLTISPFSEALVKAEGLGLCCLKRVAYTPFCASFDPSFGFLDGNPPEGAVRSFVNTRHLWKVWNDNNTIANRNRANSIILHKSLFLSRTEGSNPSLSEYLYHNDLRQQVESSVQAGLITSEYETP